MTDASVILVAAPDLVSALTARAGLTTEPLVFADSQPLQALVAITEQRPPLVVLERFFAATPRGAALINRIKADPTLLQTEIRVFAHDTDYARVIPRDAEAPPHTPTTSPTAAPTPPEPPLDYRGTRRAPRISIRPGIKMNLDGHPTVLIDLSIIGAQIVSTTSLRPNQRLRVVLTDEEGKIRIDATIVWATFEAPKGTVQYRAGVEFRETDTDRLDRFCTQHRAP